MKFATVAETEGRGWCRGVHCLVCQSSFCPSHMTPDPLSVSSLSRPVLSPRADAASVRASTFLVPFPFFSLFFFSSFSPFCLNRLFASFLPAQLSSAGVVGVGVWCSAWFSLRILASHLSHPPIAHIVPFS
ncbi:hypothetical protein DFJ73DRAFT_830296 [Zopfochytrium polystomum]|nr:hypothetical protein DFJ73DRAFT_830296 [Zopfochytrium polystomum]